ncbi:hypothetical protein TEQG_05856 [Trichophyton equinum CBS 127.97]|uniref:Uncharacterized protein n=1 Tax=Trichophyton equinum (strain ATCC MYA-4606 / CBS 127.97) TaxID=559882 RepID=F2PYL6_TRIEC|nr:hypothetical protein TEQG_05856 [Trichophyton equinum CBS 127.97]
MTGGRTGEPCLCENWSTKSRPCMQTTARSVFQANLRQGGSCYCYPVSLCGCWMYSINLEAASRVTSSSPSCLEVEEMKSLFFVIYSRSRTPEPADNISLSPWLTILRLGEKSASCINPVTPFQKKEQKLRLASTRLVECWGP